MKKLNLYVGLALVLVLIVAGALVALGKFPAVSQEEFDEMNQLCLLWLAATAGLNFFVYNAEFSPEMDRIHHATRLLSAVGGASAVASYFLEFEYGFEGRFFWQSSMLLALIALIFYFVVRHADNSES